MSYTIEQLDHAVTRAVERERQKWKQTQVCWVDDAGNSHPVPVLHRAEWGDKIIIQIGAPIAREATGG